MSEIATNNGSGGLAVGYTDRLLVEVEASPLTTDNFLFPITTHAKLAVSIPCAGRPTLESEECKPN